MRALLLDTGFSAEPILGALTRSGFEVITVGSYPQDHLAAGNERYICANYADVSEVQRIAIEVRADLIVPGCTDVSYMSACRTAKRLGMSGYDDPSLVSTLHQKQYFRRMCIDINVSVPAVFDPIAATVKCAYPLIVKPVDSYSGNGITVLRQPDDEKLAAAHQLATTYSASGEAIVEQYVEGQLYSYSAFLRAGKVRQDFLVAEYGFDTEFAVDTSYLVANEDLSRALTSITERIACHLGIQNGLLHTQFIESGDEIFVIELARRCPGDLYSELIRCATGCGYAESYLSTFIQSPLAQPASFKRTNIVRRTIKKREGELAMQFDGLSGINDLSVYPVRRPNDERVAIALLHMKSEQDRDRLLQQLAQRGNE